MEIAVKSLRCMHRLPAFLNGLDTFVTYLHLYGGQDSRLHIVRNPNLKKNGVPLQKKIPNSKIYPVNRIYSCRIFQTFGFLQCSQVVK